MDQQAFLEGYMSKEAVLLDAAVGGLAGAGIGALRKDDSETRGDATARGAIRGAGLVAGAGLGMRGGALASYLAGGSKTVNTLAAIAGALGGGTLGYQAGKGMSLSPREEAEELLEEEGREESIPKEAGFAGAQDFQGHAANTAANTGIGSVIGAGLGALRKDDSETRTEAAGRGALRGGGYALGANVLSRGAGVGAESLGADPTTVRIVRALAGLTGAVGGYQAGKHMNLSPQEEAEERAEQESAAEIAGPSREEKVKALMDKMRKA